MGIEDIAQATRGTKWEHRLWLVGGAVRDELLDLPPPADMDIVLEDDALEIAEFLWQKRVSEIKPVTYPRFGTALIHVQGRPIEIATARRESYEETSRKPRVEPATLLEDAQRRDFTINTLMRNLHTGELLDPLGGRADLENRILRTPLDPAATFSDDPLRMLRAVRFKNRFSLTPVPGLYETIRQECERLKIISYERIRDELIRMLTHESAARSLRDLMELGLLDLFAPEFAEGIGVDQGSYHAKDVWNHTLDVVTVAEQTSRDLPEHERQVVILGALLHDIAKPRTRSVEESGRIRFFNHEKVGEDMAKDILRRLTFPRKTIDDVSRVVSNHMRLGSAQPFTFSAARRLVRDMGGLLEPFLRVCEADAASIRAIPKGVNFADVREKTSKISVEQEDAPLDSPLSGAEIMEITGLPEGPEVGKLKKRLTEAVLDGTIPAGDKEAAKEFLK